jgi:hypothetical protein
VSDDRRVNEPASYSAWLSVVSERARRAATDAFLDYVRRECSREEIDAAHALVGKYPEMFESSLRAAAAASATEDHPENPPEKTGGS